MSNAHDAFDKAIGDLRAYAIAWEGEIIGRIIFRFGNAATCYAQVWGNEMTTGRATGYGYDKASTAFCKAAERMLAADAESGEHVNRWKACAAAREGQQWDARLRSAGYVVQHVM